MFLVIQEYYRNYENNNKILSDYVHDKTPKNILKLLKICLTLLYFSKKPEYAIVNDAVEEGKNLKKEKLVNAVLRNILLNKNKIKYEKFIYPNFKKILDKIFSSESIRSYIYSTIFTKPKNYQISLIDNRKAFYKKRVFIFDSYDAICPSKNLKCFVYDNSKDILYYRDSGHLLPEGIITIMPQFENFLIKNKIF